MKRFAIVFLVLLLSGQLAACSSPEEKAAEYVENANALLQEGDLNKAELEYRNALQINQNLPDAWFGLARIHEQKQQWRKLYATLNRIREINPGHVDARIMLGQVLLASNQIDQALIDANEIMELVPNDARAHSLMAAVQFRLGNFNEARDSVERALEIDAANNEAQLVEARVLITEKKYKEAIAKLDKAIQASPDNVSMYLMKIQAYSEKNDPRAVEEVYKELIKRFPDQVAYRHALARSYLQRGDSDSAEKVLREITRVLPDSVDEKIRLVGFTRRYRSDADAIELLKQYVEQNKTDYRLRFGLGELHEIAGEPGKAENVYRQVIEDDGSQSNGLEARNKLALLHLRAGKTDAAKLLVDEVLSHDKSNENALLLLAGFKIDDRNFDGAIVDLRTVLRDNPNSVKAHASLGQAYEANGSQELAMEAYTNGFKLNPAVPSVANPLARNLFLQNNLVRAGEVLQQSIKSGNNSVDALKILTNVKLRLAEWDEAERLARQLRQFKGQEAVSEQVMGVVLLGREKQSESIEAFKRAHELAPDSIQPLVSLVRTYVRSRRIDDARLFLQSVLSENDQNVTAHLLLGQLSMLENRSDEALEHFEQVIALKSEWDVGYRSLSTVYIRDNRFDEAARVTLRGLETIPDSATLAINLASIYERLGDFDKAIATYESLLERNPNLIIAKNNLASLLTDYRDDQKSLDRARRMAAEFRDSKLPQFRDTYAWAAVQAGINLEDAIAILQGIVRENEQIGIYHYHLGEAYRKKGDMENAVASLEKAISLENPGSDIGGKAKKALSRIN